MLRSSREVRKLRCTPMKKKFKECHFHDSTIENIEYDGKTLFLYIPKSYYENTYKNVKVAINVDTSCLEIFFLKQYPLFHNVIFKGREISINRLQKYFRKCYSLEINDLVVSVD